jgi:hypothetical protein
MRHAALPSSPHGDEDEALPLAGAVGIEMGRLALHSDEFEGTTRCACQDHHWSEDPINGCQIGI